MVPVGHGNRVCDFRGFVRLLAVDADFDNARVEYGAQIHPRPEQGHRFRGLEPVTVSILLAPFLIQVEVVDGFAKDSLGLEDFTFILDKVWIKDAGRALRRGCPHSVRRVRP